MPTNALEQTATPLPDPDAVLDQTLEYLESFGYSGDFDDDGRVVLSLPDSDRAESEDEAETEAEADVNNIEQILLWDGAPEATFFVAWDKDDGSYVARVVVE